MGENLKKRTKDFALRIIKLYGALPSSVEAQVIGKQILRSGTSVGAHYHESSRSRSKAEFISKIQVSLQELEETIYWLELLIASQLVHESKLTKLLEESKELIAILATCMKRAKESKTMR
ncbi:MAG: four helix bundle protein [Oculatellaceae cyanobacterium bins.114]|nr:four helix bundle protein [Oculatellaceae cyanobacterium bins.114]